MNAPKLWGLVFLLISCHQLTLMSTLPPPEADEAFTPEEAITFFSDTSSVGRPSSAALATASESPLMPVF